MRRILLFGLLLGIGACGRSSRDVMFEIEALRAEAQKGLDTRNLARAQSAGAGLAEAFGAGVVRGRHPDADYANLLDESTARAREIANAADIEAARRAFYGLQDACQRCHDVYQFKQ